MDAERALKAVGKALSELSADAPSAAAGEWLARTAGLKFEPFQQIFPETARPQVLGAEVLAAGPSCEGFGKLLQLAKAAGVSGELLRMYTFCLAHVEAGALVGAMREHAAADVDPAKYVFTVNLDHELVAGGFAAAALRAGVAPPGVRFYYEVSERCLREDAGPLLDLRADRGVELALDDSDRMEGSLRVALSEVVQLAKLDAMTTMDLMKGRGARPEAVVKEVLRHRIVGIPYVVEGIDKIDYAEFLSRNWPRHETCWGQGHALELPDGEPLAAHLVRRCGAYVPRGWQGDGAEARHKSSPAESIGTASHVLDVEASKSNPAGRAGSDAATGCEEERRIDVAAPGEVRRESDFDVLVQVCLPASPPLGGVAGDWPDGSPPDTVAGKQVHQPVCFERDGATGELRPASLSVRIVAPDFKIHGDGEKRLVVPPGEDSRKLSFRLRAPGREGTFPIDVEIYDSERAWIGRQRIPVSVDGSSSGELQSKSLAVRVTVEVVNEVSRARSVVIGGSANGATIVTGDDNVVGDGNTLGCVHSDQRGQSVHGNQFTAGRDVHVHLPPEFTAVGPAGGGSPAIGRFDAHYRGLQTAAPEGALVRVCRSSGEGKARFLGSGYSVSDRLVLTARHVVAPDGNLIPAAEIAAYFPKLDDARFEVVDVLVPGGDIDVAVLRLAEAVPGISRAPFSGIGGSGQELAWHAVGFGAGSGDACLEIRGNLLVGGKNCGGRLDLEVSRKPQRPDSGWGGLSGAPVFCGECIVGVLKQVAPDWEGRKLQATAVAGLLDSWPAFADFTGLTCLDDLDTHAENRIAGLLGKEPSSEWFGELASLLGVPQDKKKVAEKLLSRDVIEVLRVLNTAVDEFNANRETCARIAGLLLYRAFDRERLMCLRRDMNRECDVVVVDLVHESSVEMCAAGMVGGEASFEWSGPTYKGRGLLQDEDGLPEDGPQSADACVRKIIEHLFAKFGGDPKLDTQDQEGVVNARLKAERELPSPSPLYVVVSSRELGAELRRRLPQLLVFHRRRSSDMGSPMLAVDEHALQVWVQNVFFGREVPTSDPS